MPTPNQRLTPSQILIAVVAILLPLGVIWLAWSALQTPEAQVLEEVETALKLEDVKGAAKILAQLESRGTLSVKGHLVAAEVTAKMGDAKKSLKYLEDIRDEDAPDLTDLNWKRGALAMDIGQLSLSESYLLKVLKSDPKHFSARHKLVLLLRLIGRNYETYEHVIILMKAGAIAPDYMYLLGTADWIRLQEDEAKFLEACASANPKDQLPQFGKVRHLLMRKKLAEARPKLEKIVTARPDLIEAQARFGALILEQDGGPAFDAWLKKLLSDSERVAAVDEFPEFWYMRGLRAMAENNPSRALECFQQVEKRNPNHLGTCRQLAQIYETSNPELAAAFADRASHLDRCETLLRKPELIAPEMQEISERMEKMGRPWEAWGWSKIVREEHAKYPWGKVAEPRLKEKTGKDVPLNLPEFLPRGLKPSA